MKNLSNTIHNWIAVIAVLAVALLGVLAIDKQASQRDETLRGGQIANCERSNTAASITNNQIDKLNGTTRALKDALRVAQRESGQRVKDRIAYARALALLDGTTEQNGHIPLADCDKVIPKP